MKNSLFKGKTDRDSAKVTIPESNHIYLIDFKKIKSYFH
jgi:hypothetical protein